MPAPDDTSQTGPVLQQVIAALMGLSDRERRVVLSAARMYFYGAQTATQAGCACVGGLYDRTCPAHGPRGLVTRQEHDHVRTTLSNQISQLGDRVRVLEGARQKCICTPIPGGEALGTRVVHAGCPVHGRAAGPG